MGTFAILEGIAGLWLNSMFGTDLDDFLRPKKAGDFAQLAESQLSSKPKENSGSQARKCGEFGAAHVQPGWSTHAGLWFQSVEHGKLEKIFRMAVFLFLLMVISLILLVENDDHDLEISWTI